MLAGLDSVMLEGFGVPKVFPVLSLGVLIGVYFLSERGTVAIGWVNLCLVPAIVAFVVSLAFRRVDFDYAFTPAGEGIYSVLYVMLYAAMNVFLSAPVVCDLGARMKKTAGATAARRPCNTPQPAAAPTWRWLKPPLPPRAAPSRRSR